MTAAAASEREGERQWEGKIGFISKLFPLMPDRRRRRARQREDRTEQRKVALLLLPFSSSFSSAALLYFPA